jgi:hypothetical protein
MCGGIASALAMGLPPEVRARPPTLSLFVLTYNAGRVASYSLAGALAGLLFSGLRQLMPPAGHALLTAFAALILALVGLHLSGWFPQLLRIESVGAGLWKRIQPLARRLLPVRTLPQAFAFGVLWGWLPCGLVYSALVWATASADPLLGATYMGLFGLGTVPAVASIGVLSGSGVSVFQKPAWRRAFGLVLILVGVGSFTFSMLHAIHDLCTVGGAGQ